MTQGWIGIGIRRQRKNTTLDVTFITIDPIVSNEYQGLSIQEKSDGFYEISDAERSMLGIASCKTEPQAYATTSHILCVMRDPSKNVVSPEEGYFKLQLISRRLVTPHEINISGLFGCLENIAWTNYGPLLPKDCDEIRLKKLGTSQPLVVTHVDKFPYLINYHIPEGVRIADGSRVRLGAYLGKGTTVMPAGYINFNGGTMGNAMVEGRISSGVIVGDSSDVGGGASIMGTLSGGNDHIISIGEQCLLGANSGTGISLGKGCTIQAGVYITAGMKIAMLDSNNMPVDRDGKTVSEGENIVKASELSGKDYLLFMQDSRSGHIICKPNMSVIALNNELHAHN